MPNATIRTRRQLLKETTRKILLVEASRRFKPKSPWQEEYKKLRENQWANSNKTFPTFTTCNKSKATSERQTDQTWHKCITCRATTTVPTDRAPKCPSIKTQPQRLKLHPCMAATSSTMKSQLPKRLLTNKRISSKRLTTSWSRISNRNPTLRASTQRRSQATSLWSSEG